eukprot:UN28580
MRFKDGTTKWKAGLQDHKGNNHGITRGKVSWVQYPIDKLPEGMQGSLQKLTKQVHNHGLQYDVNIHGPTSIDTKTGHCTLNTAKIGTSRIEYKNKIALP